MEILTPKHKVIVKVDDLEITFSKLNYSQFLEIQNCTKIVSGESVTDSASFIFKYIKYGVKNIKGLTMYGGKPYKIEHDNDGLISDSNVEDIIMMPIRESLIQNINTIMNGNINDIHGEVEIKLGK